MHTPGSLVFFPIERQYVNVNHADRPSATFHIHSLTVWGSARSHCSFLFQLCKPRPANNSFKLCWSKTAVLPHFYFPTGRGPPNPPSRPHVRHESSYKYHNYPYLEQWSRAILSHSRIRSSTANTFSGSKTPWFAPYSERRQTSSSILARNSTAFWISPNVRGRSTAGLVASSFSGGNFSPNASEISCMSNPTGEPRVNVDNDSKITHQQELLRFLFRKCVHPPSRLLNQGR